MKLAMHTNDHDAQRDDGSRTLDTDLARRLGYNHPSRIRDLIGSHEAELRSLGSLPCAWHRPPARPGWRVRERPAMAYSLNKLQALYLTMQAARPV